MVDRQSDPSDIHLHGRRARRVGSMGVDLMTPKPRTEIRILSFIAGILASLGVLGFVLTFGYLLLGMYLGRPL